MRYFILSFVKLYMVVYHRKDTVTEHICVMMVMGLFFVMKGVDKIYYHAVDFSNFYLVIILVLIAIVLSILLEKILIRNIFGGKNRDFIIRESKEVSIVPAVLYLGITTSFLFL